MQKSPQVSWNEIYKYWSLYASLGPSILNTPISLTEIHVDFTKTGSVFYGYDWLSQDEYNSRKELIEKNLSEFLYFTKATNKGTIHTLQMLMEANDEEERAAIWIYAFAKEISDVQGGNIQRYAYQLCNACLDFLSKRYCIWHHAMKKLVPEIFINHNIYLETEFSSVNAIIELARLNAALVRYEYLPVLYSSLKSGERKADYTVRLQLDKAPLSDYP